MRLAMTLALATTGLAVKMLQSSDRLAGLGETCGGLDRSTGEPFPDCEDGLTCFEPIFMSSQWPGNTCQALYRPGEGE